MCSVGDDNIDDLENLKYMPAKETISPFSKCNKCREATPIVVLRSKDKYCRECFLTGTVHKFKALLGKHKLIRPNDRVLVVHRCGHPTTALLHFIRTGIDLNTHKKLRFEAVVVFIEEHFHLTVSERKELISKVEKEISEFQIPAYFTSFKDLIVEGVIDSALTNNKEYIQPQEDDKNVVNDHVKQLVNDTNKNDYLNITRRKFIIEIAKQLNCKFVFTPELSSDVASQLLTDITLGKGSHIALNTGFCDSRDDLVKILRPLRLFDAKELAWYNHLNNLEPVTYRIRPENPYKSVQQLMGKFVNDLQVNYPATVTTILKTGDKLTLSSKITNKCQHCGAPVEEETSELTSAEATQFSHCVSTRTANSTMSAPDQFNAILLEFDNLTCDNYCFSCKRLFKT